MYLSIVYSKRRILPSSNVCRPALPHPPDPTLRWNPPLIFRHSHRHPWHSGIYWTHHSHPTVLASEPLLVVFCAKQTFVNFCSCTFVEQFLQTDNTSNSTCTSSSTIFMPIPQNTHPSRTVSPPRLLPSLMGVTVHCLPHQPWMLTAFLPQHRSNHRHCQCVNFYDYF